MKFRIIGTIVLLVVLGGLYVLFNEEGNTQNAPTSNAQPVDSGDNALKGLKIN